MSDKSLRITEIFYSLQGEARTVGLPTVFVRLTGCPLRCVYCDTAYAFEGGERWTLQHILDEVASYSPRYITVTGGEPLAQPNCHDLLTALCEQGYEVSLETSGALPIAEVDKRVIKVVDLKTPGSGELERNLLENVDALLPHDQLKFVICNREDFDWAKALIAEYQLTERVSDILFSPSFKEQPPADLAQWILDERLPVRMQLQLHKLLWGDKQGV